MATPILTIESKSYSSFSATAASQIAFSGIIRDSAGVPLDIDTGYALKIFIAQNPSPIALVVTTDFTLGALGSDGTWSLVLTSSGSQKLPNGSRQFNVLASDDAFVTSSVAQNGSVTMSRLSN